MGLGNFFNSNDRRTRAFDERGSVIVFVALLIGVMVGVVGLVVDHSRHAVTALHLKTVADAASLAASRKLDGTHDGWRQAKRAAVAVLRQSKIYGVGNISFESASFNDGVDDPYEDSANYKATKMRVGDVALTIERGAWWYEVDEHKEDAGQQKFFSFEGLKEVNDFPPYALANAAQVSLELAEMDLTFAKVFGQSKIGTTARVSTAISDNEVQEVCVLPIAIKDCMLRMAPGAKDKGFIYDEFHAEKQCSREVATKVGMQEMPQLEEGARLAESYVLRTVPESSSAGKLPERDNKMVNIEAVFGLPTTNFQSSKAKLGDVASSLTKMANEGYCLKARIGQYFNPVENYKNFITDNRFEELFAKLINSGSQSFEEAFCSGDCSNNPSKPNRPRLPRQRFCAEEFKGTECEEFSWIDDGLKTAESCEGFFYGGSEHELTKTAKSTSTASKSVTKESIDEDADSYEDRLNSCLKKCDPYYYLYDSAGDQQFEEAGLLERKVIVSSMSQEGFTNPMCHSELVANPNDLKQARVGRYYVMVISPTREGKSYCDFEHVFGNTTKKQDAVDAEASTAPRIVGFKEVLLLDVSGKPIDAAPHPRNSAGHIVASEWRKFGKTLREWVTDYDNTQAEEEQCKANCKCTNVACSNYQSCIQDCDDHYTIDPPKNTPEAYEAEIAECFCTPDLSGLMAQAASETVDVENAYAMADWLSTALYLPAKNDKKCLALKKNECFGDGCYHMKDLDTQYGCGGVRARLSTCEKQSIAMAKPIKDARPALVQ